MAMRPQDRQPLSCTISGPNHRYPCSSYPRNQEFLTPTETICLAIMSLFMSIPGLLVTVKPVPLPHGLPRPLTRVSIAC